MTETNFKQAYLTQTFPDDNGNYYVICWVPETANLSLPITDIVPDDSLGSKGLKFDWSTHKWQVSDQDPTLIKMTALENKVTEQSTENTTLKTQLAGLLKQQALEQLGGAE